MSEQVDLIIADFDLFTRGEVIALALNVNANLRSEPPLGTPIDTGWASANWVPSVGEPYFDSHVDQVRDPTPAQVGARAQVSARGENEVLSWRLEDGPIFTSNNVPYIGALDAGHSRQSPSGFVLAAIEKAIQQTYSRGAAGAARNRRADAYRAQTGKPPRRSGK